MEISTDYIILNLFTTSSKTGPQALYISFGLDTASEERKTSVSRTVSAPWQASMEHRSTTGTSNVNNKRWSATEELLVKVSLRHACLCTYIMDIFKERQEVSANSYRYIV